MEALKNIKDQRSKFGLRNLATITYEVMYLSFVSWNKDCFQKVYDIKQNSDIPLQFTP